MKKIKRIFICTFLIFIFVLSIIAPVYGWDSHGLTLSYELTNVDWLPKYDNITVTAYSYEDVDTSAINPLFKIEYLDAEVGDKTTAAKILTTYADEPDWNMDTDLNVSKFQKFTGGSQGFRHQYYGIWFIRLGQGPERAQYWFDLAEKAHEKDDDYWTFRFLARALHQIEDLTCPYHAVPAPTGVVLKYIFRIGDLMTMATNHHYNMEAYQGQQIKMGNPLWINCLRTAQPIDIDKIKSVKWLGQYAAALVRPEVKKLWPLENEFFGPLLSERKGWYYDESKVDFAPAGTIQAEYDKEIFNSLAQFSSFSQALLLYAREKFGL